MLGQRILPDGDDGDGDDDKKKIKIAATKEEVFHQLLVLMELTF